MHTPASEQEREILVQTLMALQTGCDERHARQVLQKHNWNADQAATALLDNNTTGEHNKAGTTRSQQRDGDGWVNAGALNSSNHSLAAHPRPNSVIDLTGDDDEDTARAIEASMVAGPTFGPSNRVDETQQWAVVPSNAPPALSHEDQALNRALEASLSSSFVGAVQEPYEEPSEPIDRVRKEGWPTALRTTDFTHCYVPIVLQCIMSMPKVLERLRNSIECSGADEQDAFSQQLQRLAAIYIHTIRAYLAIDEVSGGLIPNHDFSPIGNQESLPTTVALYYGALAYSLEHIPQQQDVASERSLMYFHGVPKETDVNESSSSFSADHTVEIMAPSASGNDLLSCLMDCFTITNVCLTQLPECVAFVIRRKDVPTAPGTEKAPFKYPSRIYLDRVMQENVERVAQLQNCQEGIQHELQRHTTDRQKLSNWKNGDTLKDLEASIYYFERVASNRGDPRRMEANERTRDKLRETISEIEREIQRLDNSIKDLSYDIEQLFNKPDLQKHGYDLRAVIVYDGLFGRSHVYSYTKDDKGKWWRIVDYQVSEVTEDMVLNDPTGLHLGAGPMHLFYSRVSPIDPALESSREPHLPRIIKDLVRQDNYHFLGQLPAEVASSVTNGSAASQWLLHDEDNSTMDATSDAVPLPQEISLGGERTVELEKKEVVPTST